MKRILCPNCNGKGTIYDFEDLMKICETCRGVGSIEKLDYDVRKFVEIKSDIENTPVI